MITYIIIQLIIVWIYINWRLEMKKVSRLEVYEVNNIMNKEQFEEVVKEGIVLKFDIEQNKKDKLEQFKRMYQEERYGGFDVNSLEGLEYDEETERYIDMTLSDFNQLRAKSNKYISMNNNDYLIETGQNEIIESIDENIRPYISIDKKFDILFLNNGSITPLKVQEYNRKILYSIEGDITIKLIPNKYINNFNMYNDIINKELVSNKDVWISKKSPYKSLEIKINNNEMVYIPRGWLYSIMSHNSSTILDLSYEVPIGKLGRLGNDIGRYLMTRMVVMERYEVM